MYSILKIGGKMSSSQYQKKVKLMDQVRSVMRLKHYSYSTEKVYVYWIRNFIIFNNKRHPKELGTEDIKRYLTWLAKERRVAASTQNQALNAIVFLYKKVLNMDPGNFDGALRAKASNYIPQIISREKIFDIIESSSGIYKLMVILLYGCGLRVGEIFNLRTKDINFDQKMITIYLAKGNKSRTVMLPDFAIKYLKSLLKKNKLIYQEDCEKGRSGVEMPHALDVKYPNASKVYLHVLESCGKGVTSPLDSFGFKEIIEKRKEANVRKSGESGRTIVRIKRASDNKKGRSSVLKDATPKNYVQSEVNIIPEAIASNVHSIYEYGYEVLPAQHSSRNLQPVGIPRKSDFYPEQSYQQLSSVFP